jgi:hypothetical protein
VPHGVRDARPQVHVQMAVEMGDGHSGNARAFDLRLAFIDDIGRSNLPNETSAELDGRGKELASDGID